MAKFVSDGESRAQAVVLHDGAGSGHVAHGAQLGQPQSVAFLHLRVPANVFSAKKGGQSNKDNYGLRISFNCPAVKSPSL